MLDRTQRQVSEREEARGCLSMFDVLHKRRESLKQNDRGQVPTGWPDLDDKLGGGMRAGSLVIVGARPSVGKTSAALGMVLSAAQEGLPAVFVSLEQSQIEIANRLMCATTSLPFADIELDRLTDPLDRDRLEDAENQLANLPLKIYRRRLGATLPNPRQCPCRTPPRPATADRRLPATAPPRRRSSPPRAAPCLAA